MALLERDSSQSEWDDEALGGSGVDKSLVWTGFGLAVSQSSSRLVLRETRRRIDREPVGWPQTGCFARTVALQARGTRPRDTIYLGGPGMVGRGSR